MRKSTAVPASEVKPTTLKSFEELGQVFQFPQGSTMNQNTSTQQAASPDSDLDQLNAIIEGAMAKLEETIQNTMKESLTGALTQTQEFMAEKTQEFNTLKAATTDSLAAFEERLKAMEEKQAAATPAAEPAPAAPVKPAVVQPFYKRHATLLVQGAIAVVTVAAAAAVVSKANDAAPATPAA